MKKKVIKIKGTIINQAPAKTGYCYTLQEHKTNKQYYFFNTWELDIVQGIIYTFSLEAKTGKNKYYLLLFNCQKAINRKRAYKQVVGQQLRLSREEQQLVAANEALRELTKEQAREINQLKQLLEIKQREIDNKTEYQAQNIFDHLARVYYKSDRNATERQLLSEVDNLLNGTHLGKEWMFAFRMKQNYLNRVN